MDNNPLPPPAKTILSKAAPKAPRRVTATDRIIAANIRRLRRDRALSQEAVAAVLNVSYQQVQKYESGHNRLCLARLVLLRDFFDVPLDEFLQGAPGTAMRAPAPAQDPELRALCRKLAAIPDRGLAHKARRVLEALINAH